MTRIFYNDENPEAQQIIKDYYNFKYLIQLLFDSIKDCKYYNFQGFMKSLKISKVVLNKNDLEFLLNTSKLFFIEKYSVEDINCILKIDEDTADDEIKYIKTLQEIDLFIGFLQLYKDDFLLKKYRNYIKNHKLFSLKA
jgi:hypothetical protein